MIEYEYEADCICTAVYAPVCSNGTIYSNACVAACANVSIDSWFNNLPNDSNLHKCSTFKTENETCEGYTPAEFFEKCHPSLQCVENDGQHLVDAPGVCKPPCKNSYYDYYANCVPEDCDLWFDGCNSCRRSMDCTEKFCASPDSAYCLDDININDRVDPKPTTATTSIVLNDSKNNSNEQLTPFVAIYIATIVLLIAFPFFYALSK